MEDPLPVRVIALDPVLDAGAKSTLDGSPEVTLSMPEEMARVAIVLVDTVTRSVLDLVRETRHKRIRPEVVLVAAELVPADVSDALAAGVRGLLRRREVSTERLTRSVLTAASGDCTVPIDLLELLLEPNADGPPADGVRPSPNVSALSEREHSVLQLIAEGWETSEIAKQLNYSKRTVVTVVRDITLRYQLQNRAHAVAYALRSGLL